MFFWGRDEDFKWQLGKLLQDLLEGTVDSMCQEVWLHRVCPGPDLLIKNSNAVLLETKTILPGGTETRTMLQCEAAVSKTVANVDMRSSTQAAVSAQLCLQACTPLMTRSLFQVHHSGNMGNPGGQGPPSDTTAPSTATSLRVNSGVLVHHGRSWQPLCSSSKPERVSCSFLS